MNKLQKIAQESINEFGSTATTKKYEKIADEGLWESEKLLINTYFTPTSKILDVGCGSGRTTIPLHRLGFVVTGVDITPQMIETAKKKAIENNLKIAFQVGDATKLEFSDNTFDGAIFANNGWVQIPGKQRRQQALNEIHRVLNPSGILILTAHQRYFDTNNILFWLGKFLKHFLIKPLRINIEELEYGDIFFRRQFNGAELQQRQFIHMAGANEVENQIKNSGFKLIYKQAMGTISESDAKLMKGSLSINFNSFKSPVFYICQK